MHHAINHLKWGIGWGSLIAQHMIDHGDLSMRLRIRFSILYNFLLLTYNSHFKVKLCGGKMSINWVQFDSSCQQQIHDFLDDVEMCQAIIWPIFPNNCKGALSFPQTSHTLKGSSFTLYTPLLKVICGKPKV